MKNPDFKLRVISPESKMNAFYSQNLIFDGNFGVVHEVTDYDADPYRGEYEVTPHVNEQVLPTAQKLMVEDMTIKAIPYFETSNLSDGETVYIGTEVEIHGN